MSISYCCKRCDYKTTFLYNLKKHMDKKKQCSKNINAYSYSDDQILISTLLPYYDDKHYITDIELNNCKSLNELSKNKKELLNIIEDIEKTKCKKCNYCYEEFPKTVDLRKHILLKCFLESKQKNTKEHKNNEMYHITNNTTTSVNISNSNNNNNNHTTNNITNVNIELKTPIPFDNEWDMSQIDKSIKQNLLMSSVMYTSLLNEILKNEINLNVIIDKEAESGVVYKNNIDKYIKMKLKDIVDNTMKKLRKHLIDINKDNINTHIMPEIIDFSRKIINKKLIDYEKDNNDIAKNVVGYISDIYDSKKYDAIMMSSSIRINESANNHKIKGGF